MSTPDRHPDPLLSRWLRPAVALALALPAVPASAQMMDDEIHGYVLLDRLELAPGRPGTPVELDALGWVGGDWNRLWVRAEGSQRTESEDGELKAEAFYGRLIAPYWDALVGLSLETSWGSESHTRASLAVGLTGLAPYWFELEPTLYLSQDGDLSAELQVEYELLFTQRLILQPLLTLKAAAQEVPEFMVASGLNSFELGARLRYEVVREFAPYVGISWIRRTFGTAALYRDAGEPAGVFSVVAGLRVWY